MISLGMSRPCNMGNSREDMIITADGGYCTHCSLQAAFEAMEAPMLEHLKEEEEVRMCAYAAAMAAAAAVVL